MTTFQASMSPTRRARAALTFALLVAIAAPAQAAPVLVDAELRLSIPGLGQLTISSTGSIDVSGVIYQIPAGLITQPAAILVPVTTTTSVHSIEAMGVSNLAASLSLGGATGQVAGEICMVPGSGEGCVVGGGLGGVMGLDGTFLINIIPTVVVIFFDLAAQDVGQGGFVGAPWSAENAPWTTGTALVNPFNSVFSSQGGPTSGGGISLVTGSYINVAANRLPLFARLTLTPVVPEPSVILMFAAGVAGLTILRRQQR